MRRSRLIALVAFAACLQAAGVAGPIWLAARYVRAVRGGGPDARPRPIAVAVRVACPSFGAEECDREIAVPLERRLTGIAGVERIRSDSFEGGATVVLEWPAGADADRGLADVCAALEGWRSGPREAERPVVTRVSSGPKLRYTIESPQLSLRELRRVQDWQVRPALLSIPGVRRIESFGGREREVEVALDVDRLAAFGLDAAAVVTALRSNRLELPAGSVRAGSREYIVPALGRDREIDDLADVVIALRSGAPVRVRDVAVVSDGIAPVRSLALRTGRREVVAGVIAVDSQDGGALQAVRSRLRELGAAIPPWVELRPFDEPAGATIHVALDLPGALSDKATWNHAELIFGGAVATLGEEALGVLGPRGFEVTVRAGSALAARDALQDIGRKLPGVRCRVLSGTAGAEAFEVRICGSDRSVLGDLATSVARVLGSMPGVAGVEVLGAGRVPRRVVRLDRARAADAGVALADAEIAVEVAQGGVETARFSLAGETAPVVVRARAGPDLASVRVRRADGGVLPLADLVSIVHEGRPDRLLRENGRPLVVVRVAAVGGAVASFEARARDGLAREIGPPEGYALTVLPAPNDD